MSGLLPMSYKQYVFFRSGESGLDFLCVYFRPILGSKIFFMGAGQGSVPEALG